MKAGIYQRRDNKKLIYVAKDRSVRAYEDDQGRAWTIVESEWKVSAQQKEQVVTWASFSADRVADAPNGCTDHVRALTDYRLEQRAQATPPVGEGHNRQLVAYAAGVVENHLADHPPEQRVEQPDTDVTDPEPATPDFAQRAQAQVDTVNAYELAKKDLQFMLYAEQVGVVRWIGHDWEILDVHAWNELNDAPPKLLPVLPDGFVASRAAAYIVNKGVGIMPKAPTTGGRYHSGGFTSDFGMQPGEVPVILERGEFRTVDFETAERLAAGVRQGAESAIQSFEVTAAGCTSEAQAKNLVEKYRKVFRPSELRTFAGPCPAGAEIERYQERVRAGELRLIGKQSKRKHRKAGHQVFWCAPLRSWVWEVQS